MYLLYLAPASVALCSIVFWLLQQIVEQAPNSVCPHAQKYGGQLKKKNSLA